MEEKKAEKERDPWRQREITSKKERGQETEIPRDTVAEKDGKREREGDQEQEILKQTGTGGAEKIKQGTETWRQEVERERQGAGMRALRTGTGRCGSNSSDHPSPPSARRAGGGRGS